MAIPIDYNIARITVNFFYLKINLDIQNAKYIYKSLLLNSLGFTK